MPERLSRPIEFLIENAKPDPVLAEADALVVGSGYGGAIAAARLAGPGRTVFILERGNEYALGDFPNDIGDVPRHVRFHRHGTPRPTGYPDALFDFRMGRDMDVLVGSGLGGTSLINANVAAIPDPDVFAHTAWPQAIRNESLAPHFKAVSDLLGVNELSGVPKFAALAKLASALGTKCTAAPIAVTVGKTGIPVPNAVGVPQQPCTKCGNCVSGCNVGAKNTLMMNALPLAAERGAAIFTGATVLTVKPDVDGKWLVRLRRTASAKTPMEGEVFLLKARVVVLAAGTLGSTEILMRSRESHALPVSGQLGKSFSGNGDALAFGYGQQQAVNAVGEADQHKASNVGPTITGIARPMLEDRDLGSMRITLEDGAVPAALRRLFEEMVTTAAQLRRLGDGDPSAWHESHPGVDPLAVTAAARQHSQVLLAMGDDGAKGTLELQRQPGQPLDDAQLVVEWPGVGANDALRIVGRNLQMQDRKRGFDGGQYLANPLWQLLPEMAGEVMSGGAPGGRAVTVHPLGGCPMGEDFHSGVVDHCGQVFREAAAAHEGLYVLDGSIIPKALGINPFLTIAALSHRAAQRIADKYGWAQSAKATVSQPAASILPPEEREPVRATGPVHVTLRERLIGTLDTIPAWLLPLDPKRLPRWTEDKGLILDVDMDVADAERWLDLGPAEPLPARAKLYSNSVPAEDTRRSQMYHTPDDHIGPEDLMAEGKGRIWLLQPDVPGWLALRWRATQAALAFFARRKPFWSIVGGSIAGSVSRWASSTPPPADDKPGAWAMVAGFWNVAKQHATYRRLRYEVDFEKGDHRFTLSGEKLLAWKNGTPRVWDALFTLPFTLRDAGGSGSVGGSVEVDSKYLATIGAPQVISSPHLPASVAALSGIGMLFVRAILQTHFWDFGAPDYPKEPLERPTQPARLRLPGGREVAPDVTHFTVPVSACDPNPVRLRLARYRQPPRVEAPKPVLLIHGLAQGSLIFTEPMLDVNMAAYLYEQKYDVWVLDYRLSNALQDPVPQGHWAMDELGEFDIPVAVRQVSTATGQRVRVFSHCVGATALAMAILRGRLSRAELECVAFNAIHPWIMPSAVNEFRALLGKFFRDVLGKQPLDPIPAPNPGGSQVIFDRLAFSLSRYGEMPGDGHELRAAREMANTVCDRMSLLYGRMWWHANLDERTHAAFPRIVGPSPGEVYRHMYYLTTRKRVVTAQGTNGYLTDRNLVDHWNLPTFFFHGEQSMVFNPQSATRSALRLNAVVNDAAAQAARGSTIPIGFRRFPRYGHMDVVFAKTAHEDAYDTLRQFFARPDSADKIGEPLRPSDDVHIESLLRLSTGPILRAAWVRDGAVCMRLWGENTEEATTLIHGLQFVGRNSAAVGSSWTVGDCEERYQMVDAQIAPSGPVEFDLETRGIGSQLQHLVDLRLQWQQSSDWSPRYAFHQRLGWLGRLRSLASSGAPATDMRFLVGSCRYPGTPFERDQADAVFGGMLAHVLDTEERPGVHMQFLIGDQIYADATADILDTSVWRERFSERYRDAFTSANMRNLLWQVPTHFAIDDHEIADDWSGGPPMGGKLDDALRAARSFQSSERDTHPVGAGTGTPLWYAVDDAAERCCPAFVMNTRSEREPRGRGGVAAPEMIGPGQLQALRDWLTDSNKHRCEAPKFIFSGTGIAPISRAFAREKDTWRSQDGWLGYPDTAATILSYIVELGVQNVVFVSGDLHLSALSRLTLSHQGNSATCWQVVSSGLYCPLPFGNAQPRDFDWGRAVRTQVKSAVGAIVDIAAESWLLQSGPPHFVRVDAEARSGHWTMAVGVYGANGVSLPADGVPPPGVTMRADGAWVIGFRECVVETA